MILAHLTVGKTLWHCLWGKTVMILAHLTAVLRLANISTQTKSSKNLLINRNS
jgi:hypothetical protein